MVAEAKARGAKPRGAKARGAVSQHRGFGGHRVHPVLALARSDPILYLGHVEAVHEEARLRRELHRSVDPSFEPVHTLERAAFGRA